MSAGLSTRPSATTYELEELVRHAWEGKIRVPHFQRDFRWDRGDVIRLFDSILKGYPIGSLLLWIAPAKEETVRLGGLELPSARMDEALWVVDGQQRIASLASALHEAGAGDPRFALAYDLHSERFVPRPAQESPLVIPLPVVFDLQRLIRWFATHPEVADRLDEASRVAKALRQFPVPAYQVTRTENVEVLQDIFDRMNNYGKRLKRAEIFSALYPGAPATAAERVGFTQIADQINSDLGFGQIDSDTVVRAILARRGPDVMREIRIEFNDAERREPVEFPGEDRDHAYRAGEEALRRAVTFLENDAGVPHFTMLAYHYLLIVLARFFAHHPDPDTWDRQLLRRWYWRAALYGPGIFKGGTTGATRLLCSKVDPRDQSGSVQALLDAVRRNHRPPLPDLDRFKTNEAGTKIALCVWWSREPRSPKSGDPYGSSQLSDLLAEVTTASEAVRRLLSRSAVPPEYRLWAANRVLMPTQDEEVNEVDSLFVQQPLDLDDDDWAAVLRSHAMTPRMTALLASGSVEAYLKERQDQLRADLQEFLDRMAEWEFEDTPPIEQLLIGDPDEEDDGAL